VRLPGQVSEPRVEDAGRPHGYIVHLNKKVVELVQAFDQMGVLLAYLVAGRLQYTFEAGHVHTPRGVP
jgi:hypothetical protein